MIDRLWKDDLPKMPGIGRTPALAVNWQSIDIRLFEIVAVWTNLSKAVGRSSSDEARSRASY